MTDAEPKPETAWYAKPWFLISGAFLALLIIASVLVLVLVPGPEISKPVGDGGNGGTDTDTVQPPINAGESICGLPAGDQDIPHTEAPATTWSELPTGETVVTVPWSPKGFGPGRVSDETGAPSCYAHNPTGALYAAGAAATLSATQQFDSLAEMLVQGAAANELREYTAPPMDPNFSMWVTGYQFLSYSDALAVISVAASASNGALVSWPMTLEWVDGDWKVQVPAEGKAPFTQLESLNGFVGWSGGL